MLFLVLSCSQTENSKISVHNEAKWMDYDVTTTGPFSVGHMQLEHTYFPISEHEARTIKIDVWYPSSEETGDDAQYL